MTLAVPHSAPLAGARHVLGASADWLLPVSDIEPCGPNLEYDPEYAMLWTRLQPRGEAQYGSFVDTPEGPNWAEVERDCRRLLLRTKDLHLIICLTRARTRLGQAAGLLGSCSSNQSRTWRMAASASSRVTGRRPAASGGRRRSTTAGVEVAAGEGGTAVMASSSSAAGTKSASMRCRGRRSGA